MNITNPGDPPQVARIGVIVDYLTSVKYSRCNLLPCEELACLTGRVALEEVRVGGDSRVVEHIRV